MSLDSVIYCVLLLIVRLQNSDQVWYNQGSLVRNGLCQQAHRHKYVAKC